MGKCQLSDSHINGRLRDREEGSITAIIKHLLTPHNPRPETLYDPEHRCQQPATRPPPRPSSLPELCAADEAVASALEAVLSALEAVLSANTRLDIHLLPLGQGR